MRLSFLFALLFCAFKLTGQITNSKLSVAQQVFDNLVDAYGNNKSAPTFKILPVNSPKVIAQYIAYPTATIEIDEDLYDICMSFGKDSMNALAIVLSHELAHYYNDHNWCSDYAFALQNSTLGKTLIKVSKETKIEKESIADSYGLFYASIAGYQPFEIFSPLLDKVYSHYKLPEIVQGYPSRKERNEINLVQKEKIGKLVPVFEAGIILLHLKYFEEAGLCFEYLTRFFPSREMYNNLGVCKLFQALDNKPSDSITFIYPIEIDASSRIFQNRERGNNEDITNKEIKFNAFYKEAKAAFEKAISLDATYINSYVNLACLYDIRGNFQAALGIITEAANLPSANNSSLQMIKAIALFHENKVQESKKILSELNSIDSGAYSYNYQLLLKAVSSDNDAISIGKWKNEWVKTNTISSDTCLGQVKILSKFYNDVSNPLVINENLTIGSFSTTDGSIVSIANKEMKIHANVRIYKASNPDNVISHTSFMVNNSNCFIIRLPDFNWHIVYKEFMTE